MAAEWPRSYLGQSTVESEGDALKTGHMTGTLKQCPKLCPYINVLHFFPVSCGCSEGLDAFSVFFKLLKNCGWIRPVLSRSSFVNVPLIFPRQQTTSYRIDNRVFYRVWLRPDRLMGRTHTHTHITLIPPWEDQCEWHRMTRMTGPDCVVM